MPLLETRWSQGFWISEENLPESLPTLVLRVEANEGKLAAGFFSAVFGILVAFVVYAIDKDSLYPVDALGAARLVTLAVWTVIWLQYFAVMTRRLTKWSRQVSRVTDVPAVLLVFHRGYVEAVVAELHRLAIAAYNGHAQIVELLLERGATLIDCDVSHTAGGWAYTMGPPRVCDVLWRLVSAVRLPEDANLARLDDHELLDLASMYCTRRSYRRRHPCFVYRWLVHLLLCFGRFGGDGSALSRLPTEMVLEIVGFLRFGDMRPIPRAHDTRRLQ
eukprot:m.311661 g.311661  ORF g.311661 m.311661 type:complete len:275 (-) comp16386_c0_seq5:5448-6272(-)